MGPTTKLHAREFERMRPRLKAISLRIVGSEAEAEDVVQDSYLIYLKWHGAERGALATPAAWLTTVVQHQSIDRLRKRARDELAGRSAFELAADAVGEGPEDALLRRAELEQALARMLARLSASERLALVLHEVFECGHADIAAVLGTREANARQYLARARRRLREGDDGRVRPEEKLCRELVLRFQAAINRVDVAAVVSLLADEQQVAVRGAPRMRAWGMRCANDASYGVALAA
jgi:RNA polymerase sigma-70 factor (ECF subfamily)